MIRSQIFIFLLLLAGLSSCLTIRQIERNCDKFAQVCITDSQETMVVHDSVFVEKRDTIVEYVLERDTITNAIFVPSVPLSVSSDTSYLTTGLARSTAFIWRSQLFHTLESGDTILNIRLNDALTEITHLRRELNKKVQTVTVKENTPFGKFAVKWFIGSLILIILFVAWKIWG